MFVHCRLHLASKTFPPPPKPHTVRHRHYGMAVGVLAPGPLAGGHIIGRVALHRHRASPPAHRGAAAAITCGIAGGRGGGVMGGRRWELHQAIRSGAWLSSTGTGTAYAHDDPAGRLRPPPPGDPTCGAWRERKDRGSGFEWCRPSRRSIAEIQGFQIVAQIPSMSACGWPLPAPPPRGSRYGTARHGTGATPRGTASGLTRTTSHARAAVAGPEMRGTVVGGG